MQSRKGCDAGKGRIFTRHDRTASGSRRHRFTMMINENRPADYALDARLARLTTSLLWLLFGCFVAVHLFPGRLNPIQHVINREEPSEVGGERVIQAVLQVGVLASVRAAA